MRTSTPATGPTVELAAVEGRRSFAVVAVVVVTTAALSPDCRRRISSGPCGGCDGCDGWEATAEEEAFGFESRAFTRIVNCFGFGCCCYRAEAKRQIAVISREQYCRRVMGVRVGGVAVEVVVSGSSRYISKHASPLLRPPSIRFFARFCSSEHQLKQWRPAHLRIDTPLHIKHRLRDHSFNQIPLLPHTTVSGSDRSLSSTSMTWCCSRREPGNLEYAVSLNRPKNANRPFHTSKCGN